MVIGGSISRYYAGNFGQFLQFGCHTLEVVNRGETGASASKMLKNFHAQVVGEAGVFTKRSPGHDWLLVQGGLNSVGAPQATAWWLSRLFVAAHTEGIQVVALSLSPWGDDADPRFEAWRGLRLQRATQQVVDFVMGSLTPATAFGARTAQRPATPQVWLPGELAELPVDLWRSPLAVGATAKLRDVAALQASLPTSPYRRSKEDQTALVAAAVAVPRQFLASKYRDFDHTHPNTAGHRLMAALVCQRAPAAWACDCDQIRRAVWRRGAVAAGAP